MKDDGSLEKLEGNHVSYPFKIADASSIATLFDSISEIFFFIGSGLKLSGEENRESRDPENEADEIFANQGVEVKPMFDEYDRKYISSIAPVLPDKIISEVEFLRLSDLKNKFEQINNICCNISDLTRLNVNLHAYKGHDFIVFDWGFNDEQTDESTHTMYTCSYYYILRVELSEGMDQDSILEYLGFYGKIHESGIIEFKGLKGSLRTDALSGIYKHMYEPKTKLDFDPNSDENVDNLELDEKINKAYSYVDFCYDKCSSSKLAEHKLFENCDYTSILFRTAKKIVKHIQYELYDKYNKLEYSVLTSIYDYYSNHQTGKKYVKIECNVEPKLGLPICYCFTLSWPLVFNGEQTTPIQDIIKYLELPVKMKDEKFSMEGDDCCDSEHSNETQELEKQERAEEKNVDVIFKSEQTELKDGYTNDWLDEIKAEYGEFGLENQTFSEAYDVFRNMLTQLEYRSKANNCRMDLSCSDYGQKRGRKHVFVDFIIWKNTSVIGKYMFGIVWPADDTFSVDKAIGFFKLWPATQRKDSEDNPMFAKADKKSDSDESTKTKEERAEKKNNSVDAMKMLMRDVTGAALVTGEAKHNNINVIKMLVRDVTGVELVVEFAPGEEVSIDKVKEKLDKQWHGFPHSEPVYFQFLYGK